MDNLIRISLTNTIAFVQSPIAMGYCLFGEEGWNLRKIENLLERDSSRLFETVRRGYDTPLLAAVKDPECPVEIIEVLLRYGSEVNFVDKNGLTPFIAAVMFIRDESVVRLLVEYGANVSYLLNGPTALCHAFQYGRTKDFVQLLLDVGTPVNGCRQHASAVICALVHEAYRGGLTMDDLDLLIERGADTTAIALNGCSVICLALQHYEGDMECFIERLCLMGGSLSDCIMHTSPFFCMADNIIRPCFYGNSKYFRQKLTAKLVEYFLCKDVPLDKVDNNGLTPLQSALQQCRYEAGAISLLLQHFPDLAVVDKFNNNLLHLACTNTFYVDPIVVKLLIKRGVCVDSANIKGETAMHQAVNNERCDSSVIRLLLKHGAAVNAENNCGETPLKLSMTRWFSMDKIRLLLAAGGDVGVDKNRPSLLESALYKCEQLNNICSSYFKLLLQYSLLKNPDLCIEGIIKDRKNYKPLSKYWRDCLVELKQMESVTVGDGCTLREFLSSYSTPEKVHCQAQGEKYDCNQLLSIKANMYPLFRCIISIKVDRFFMKAKLKEMPVYTIKYANTPHKEERKIVLDHESVLNLIRYLVNEDLLRMVVAWMPVDTAKESIGMDACGHSKRKHLIKRNSSFAEEVTEFSKQPKLASKFALQ